MNRSLVTLGTTAVLAAWLPAAVAVDVDAAAAALESAAASAAALAHEREAQFARARDEARAELAGRRRALDAMQRRYETRRAELAAAEARLEQARRRVSATSSDLADLFEAARFEARSLREFLLGSPLGAQFPDRLATLAAIGESRGAVPPADFETLWLTMLRELTASGQVSRFRAPDGSTLTRIGTFALYGDDGVVLTTGDNQLYRPDGMPRGLTAHARAIHRHTGGVTNVVVDPTHGRLMRRESVRPGALDRLRQGGPIGLVIVVLGAGAAALALARWLALARTGRRMRASSRGQSAVGNPLSRLLGVYDEHRDLRHDDLALLLDEKLVDEAAGLERGQSLIRVIAALAPLLGLLGTVTGMIAMFRTIEVVGSGSPAHTAGAVALALWTTLLGLSVAVVLALVHAGLHAFSTRLIVDLETRVAAWIATHRAARRRGLAA